MPEPHEPLPQNADDMERFVRIDRLLEDYFSDDIKFTLEELEDDEDVMEFLYGQLIEIGEDPDEVFERYGVTEGDDEV
jgi:hypothetical protein